MAAIPFTKMHGAGNDYVYVDAITAPELAQADLPRLSREMSDRHTGVGSDGLIVLLPPDASIVADIRMRMFNADGSESEMCGNGIRCVAKFAHDRGLTRARPIRVHTGAGVRSIDYTTNGDGTVDTATVDMGEPAYRLDQFTVDRDKIAPDTEPYVSVFSAGVRGTLISMGNPHLVVFVDELTDQHLTLGPGLECHAAFLERMNVHFVRVDGPAEVTAKHWERGSGPTMACGTGACAICVAGVLTGRTTRDLLAHLPGGDLKLHWSDADNHVSMTGPAVEVFTGEWELA